MQKLLRKIDRMKSDDPTSPMTDKTPMDRRIEEVHTHTHTHTHAHTHTLVHVHTHTHTHTQLEEELDKLKVECEQLKEQTIVSPLQDPSHTCMHTRPHLHHTHTPTHLTYVTQPSNITSYTPSQVASRERKFALDEKDQAVSKLHTEKTKNSRLKAKVHVRMVYTLVYRVCCSGVYCVVYQ